MLATNNIIINDATISKRHKDANGYLIINNNPIAKAGVFDYLESEVKIDGDTNKIVKVYRPFENLQKIKNDFAKKPILYNHDWVGDGKNSVDGAIGDLITTNEPYLVADLIIYNPDLIKVIEDNTIKELSPGYNASFIEQSGVFNDEEYQYIQTLENINHLAVVETGRSGSDLRILDTKKQRIDNMHKKTTLQKVIDSLKRIVKDETPDELLSEIDRIKSIPDDEYEGGAEAKLKAIEELQAKLELIEDEDKDDKIINDDIDRRELIREIMALSAKSPSDFQGGETEQVETISKLAEKLAYSKDKTMLNKSKDDDMAGIDKNDDINISAETLKEIIEKVTDNAINKKMQSINIENKKIFDSYQDVKNIIGDFDYRNKNSNDIYSFGYEIITGEKLDKTLDAKTAFLFASKNKKQVKQVIDSVPENNTKIDNLASMLDNFK